LRQKLPETGLFLSAGIPMEHESTSMEVEGTKGASTLASASDASASGAAMSGLAVGVHRAEGGSASGATPIASLHEAAANEVRAVASAEPIDARDEDELAGAQSLAGETRAADRSKQAGNKKHTNNLRKLRIERMMSKAELARRANLSVLTIDRIEKGFGCRMDSKRKILEALGLSLADRVRVFGEEE
jgi:DNA-binding XRE family transcriptional regulator